jgi:hypothetical protein
MPAFVHPDGQPTPRVVSETPTTLVIEVELAKETLIRHRDFLGWLFAAAHGISRD